MAAARKIVKSNGHNHGTTIHIKDVLANHLTSNDNDIVEELDTNDVILDFEADVPTVEVDNSDLVTATRPRRISDQYSKLTTEHQATVDRLIGLLAGNGPNAPIADVTVTTRDHRWTEDGDKHLIRVTVEVPAITHNIVENAIKEGRTTWTKLINECLDDQLKAMGLK